MRRPADPLALEPSDRWARSRTPTHRQIHWRSIRSLPSIREHDRSAPVKATPKTQAKGDDMTTAQQEEIEHLALEADVAVGGGLRAVEVAAVVLVGLLVCPPLAILVVVVAVPLLVTRGRPRASRCGARDAVRARPALPRAPRRPPGAAGASPPPGRPSAVRSRAAPDPRRRPQTRPGPVTATVRHLRPRGDGIDAADDHGRAVLRPRLRLRGHPAVAPDPRRPLRRRRGAGGVPAARRLVGVDLHDLDGQLVRSGLAGGPRGAHRGDARQPAHGRRAARGVRQAGAGVRGELRRAAGRSQRRGGVAPAPPPPAARRVRAAGRLERRGRRAVARRRGARRRPAARAVDTGPRARARRARGGLLAAGPWPHRHDRLRHRGRALRRALPDVHPHRARRIDRGHGSNRVRGGTHIDGRALPQSSRSSRPRRCGGCTSVRRPSTHAPR